MGQWLRTHGSNAAAADFAVVDSGKWCRGPVVVGGVVFQAVFEHKKMRVFAVRHRFLQELGRLMPIAVQRPTRRFLNAISMARSIAGVRVGS